MNCKFLNKITAIFILQAFCLTQLGLAAPDRYHFVSGNGQDKLRQSNAGASGSRTANSIASAMGKGGIGRDGKFYYDLPVDMTNKEASDRRIKDLKDEIRESVAKRKGLRKIVSGKEAVREVDWLLGRLEVYQNCSDELLMKNMWPHMKELPAIIKMLDPGASPELLIAGMLHDADRFFDGYYVMTKDHGSPDSDRFRQYYRPVQHPRMAAEAAMLLLRQLRVGRKLLRKIDLLIRNHEVGFWQDRKVIGKGYSDSEWQKLNKDVNTLKDADAISLFTPALLTNLYTVKEKTDQKDTVTTHIYEKYERVSDKSRGVIDRLMQQNKDKFLATDEGRAAYEAFETARSIFIRSSARAQGEVKFVELASQAKIIFSYAARDGQKYSIWFTADDGRTHFQNMNFHDGKFTAYIDGPDQSVVIEVAMPAECQTYIDQLKELTNGRGNIRMARAKEGSDILTVLGGQKIASISSQDGKVTITAANETTAAVAADAKGGIRPYDLPLIEGRPEMAGRKWHTCDITLKDGNTITLIMDRSATRLLRGVYGDKGNYILLVKAPPSHKKLFNNATRDAIAEYLGKDCRIALSGNDLETIMASIEVLTEAIESAYEHAEAESNAIYIVQELNKVDPGLKLAVCTILTDPDVLFLFTDITVNPPGDEVIIGLRTPDGKTGLSVEKKDVDSPDAAIATVEKWKSMPAWKIWLGKPVQDLQRAVEVSSIAAGIMVDYVKYLNMDTDSIITAGRQKLQEAGLKYDEKNLREIIMLYCPQIKAKEAASLLLESVPADTPVAVITKQGDEFKAVFPAGSVMPQITPQESFLGIVKELKSAMEQEGMAISLYTAQKGFEFGEELRAMDITTIYLNVLNDAPNAIVLWHRLKELIKANGITAQNPAALDEALMAIATRLESV